jgi:hypothetical protein
MKGESWPDGSGPAVRVLRIVLVPHLFRAMTQTGTNDEKQRQTTTLATSVKPAVSSGNANPPILTT